MQEIGIVSASRYPSYVEAIKRETKGWANKKEKKKQIEDRKFHTPGRAVLVTRMRRRYDESSPRVKLKGITGWYRITDNRGQDKKVTPYILGVYRA